MELSSLSPTPSIPYFSSINESAVTHTYGFKVDALLAPPMQSVRSHALTLFLQRIFHSGSKKNKYMSCSIGELVLSVDHRNRIRK